MKSRLLTSFVLGASLLIACSPAFGHHGRATYDNTKRITIKGTVTEFQWRNPHSQIYVDVKDDKGQVVNWAIEMNSPGNLVERGAKGGIAWTKDALMAGDAVTISFNPTKNGTPFGLCPEIDRVRSGQTTHLSDCNGQPAQ
jgi:hypothetical protein